MNQTNNVSSALAPIWRRKWLILAIGILVGAGSYAHYKKAKTVYSVKTQLYLGAAAEGQALLNNTLGKTKLNSTAIANQAQLINSTIGEIVKKKFRLEHNHDAVKGKVKAKATASSEFIQMVAEARTATAASEVANAYAQTYIKRHQANYERAVRSAIATTRTQIARIERAETQAKAKAGKGASSNSSASTLQTAALSTKLNQLESRSRASSRSESPARQRPNSLVRSRKKMRSSASWSASSSPRWLCTSRPRPTAGSARWATSKTSSAFPSWRPCRRRARRSFVVSHRSAPPSC
jgi:capsular polysaccharide biosynthesis protein